MLLATTPYPKMILKEEDAARGRQGSGPIVAIQSYITRDEEAKWRFVVDKEACGAAKGGG